MDNTSDVVERLRTKAEWVETEFDIVERELLTEAADTIERLRAELAAKVPEGYVVVPVEPTKDMLKAGARKSPPHGTYKAMIAASERERAMDELIAGDADLIAAAEGE